MVIGRLSNNSSLSIQDLNAISCCLYILIYEITIVAYPKTRMTSQQ